MGLFSLPLALAATTAIPLLAAIYLLRSRYRRQPVSSLMFWTEHRWPQSGGHQLHRIQTPLLLLLELLALICLILAAAGPHWTVSNQRTPLIVILDDSYSMLAGGDDSPRHRALKHIKKAFIDKRQYDIRYVLAGGEPQLLGATYDISNPQNDLAEIWRCLSPQNNIDQALALAMQMIQSQGQVAVLTDHPPPKDFHSDQVRWWAFGKPTANVAIVNAARSEQDEKQRCLFEVANFSPRDQNTLLRITEVTSGRPVQSYRLTLAANQTQRLFADLPEGSGAIAASLQDDALPMDNRVLLLPPPKRPVQVDVQVQNERLRTILIEAIDATKLTQGTQRLPNPHLIITDRVINPSTPTKPPTSVTQSRRDLFDEPWTVHCVVDEKATPYLGPFVMDQTHPLTKGLSLEGTIWAAGPRDQMLGQPVITAGQIPLITDLGRRSGRRDIRLYYQPARSTFHTSANFPAFVWNLLQWRRESLPGFASANVRMGRSVSLALSSNETTVQVTAPDQTKTSLPVVNRTVTILSQQPGLYRIRTENQLYSFACNALSVTESNLTRCATTDQGRWVDQEIMRQEQQDFTWLIAAVALSVMCVHAMVLSTSQSERARELIADERANT